MSPLVKHAHWKILPKPHNFMREEIFCLRFIKYLSLYMTSSKVQQCLSAVVGVSVCQLTLTRYDM